MSAKITVLDNNDVRDIMARTDLSEQDKIAMVSKYNPAIWAANNLNDPMNKDKKLDIRWYQDEMLTCKNDQIAVRCGRQIGKTVSMCIRIIWSCINFPGHEIVFIAPGKPQLTTFFDTFDSLIYSSDEIQSEIAKPYSDKSKSVEWKNGSIIRAFPVNQHPNSPRSAHADWVFVDECDYLNQASIASISGLRMGRKGIGLWVTSTPTGARSFFYNCCNSDSFDEFHYTSRVNPDWDDEMEQQQRDAYIGRQNDFVHEVEAEWGELDYAIFKPALIEKAIDKAIDPQGKYQDKKTGLTYYSLGQIKPTPAGRYLMGIDWNGQTKGVHIVIMEIKHDRLWVVDKAIITAAEYTQIAAVQSIIELERKWRPEWIYADEGYGTMQIETLKKYGTENLETAFATRLVAVDFKKTKEVQDPISKEIVKKPLKPLIIDTAARFLELERVIVPPQEDKTGGLLEQMRNFKVKNVNHNGQPIYSQDNDHTLIAWAMCIYCYAERYTDMFLPKKLVTRDIPGNHKQISGGNIATSTVDLVGVITKGNAHPIDRAIKGGSTDAATKPDAGALEAERVALSMGFRFAPDPDDMKWKHERTGARSVTGGRARSAPRSRSINKPGGRRLG